MKRIACPKCGNTIDLESNFCSNCGFDIQHFLINPEELYEFGLDQINRNPDYAFIAFKRGSELKHAPCMYQLGILYFTNKVSFLPIKDATKKRNYEYCFLKAAQLNYNPAINKLIEIYDYLESPEAKDFVDKYKAKHFQSQINGEKLSKTNNDLNDADEDEPDIQRLKDEIDADIKSLEKIFRNIRKPYYYSKETIHKIFNRLISYSQDFLEHYSFYQKIRAIEEQVRAEEKVVDELNSKMQSINLYSLTFSQILPLYNEYEKLPSYLKKYINNHHRLCDAYDRAEQYRKEEEKVTSLSILKKEEDTSNWMDFLDDFYAKNAKQSSISGTGKVTKAKMLNDPDYLSEKQFFNDTLVIADRIYEKASTERENYYYALHPTGLTRSEITDYYNDYKYNLAQYEASEENLINARKIYNRPYFARVKTKNSDFYIGDYGFGNRIIDWRSKKARLYYEYKYELENINLVRSFDIRCSRLIDYENKYIKGQNKAVDYVITDDEFLNRALEYGRESKTTHDIIKTIQKEQYEMMTCDYDKNMLVNGSAGSGKTMVLLHRLSYLLYNKSYKPNDIYIISPTRFLDNELDFLSQSLDLNNVFKSSYIDYLCSEISKAFESNNIPYDKDYFKNVYTIDEGAITNLTLANNFFTHVQKSFDMDSKDHSSFKTFYSDELWKRYGKYIGKQNAKLIDPDSVNYKAFILLAYLIKECSSVDINKVFEKIDGKGKDKKSEKLSEDDKNSCRSLLSISYRIHNHLFQSKDNKRIISEWDDKTSFDKQSPEEKIKILLESFGSKAIRKKQSKIAKNISILFKQTTKDALDVPFTFVNSYLNLLNDFDNYQSFINGEDNYNLLFEILIFNINVFKKSRLLSTSKTFDFEIVFMSYVLQHLFEPVHSFGLLMLDEYQNYSRFEISILSGFFSKFVFNMFGDVNQTCKRDGVGFDSRFNDYLETNNFAIFKTNINYRNAREITEFINYKLGFDMIPVGVSGNVEAIQLKEIFGIKHEKDDRIALVVKNIDYFREYLQKSFVNNKEKFLIINDDSTIVRNTINVIDINFVKGLEFDIVYVFDIDMTKNEKYVAYTRALKSLFVIE